MNSYDYYLVPDGPTELLAKEFLRAEVNLTRAYEHSGGNSELFKKYVFQMCENYVKLVERLNVHPGFVKTPGGQVPTIRVERMAYKTVLQIPTGMKLRSEYLEPLSDMEYAGLRSNAMRAMGMDFGTGRAPRKGSSDRPFPPAVSE